MVEAAAEANEELMNKYLEIERAFGRGDQEGPAPAHHRQRDRADAVRHRVQEQGRAGDAGRRDRLPAFARGHPAGQGRERRRASPISRKPVDDEPFAALAFKIMTDPFVGQLSFIRVYSGVLQSGDTVLTSVRGSKERIGRLLQMHANEREEIEEVRAGDIAAVVGLKDVITGETICDVKKSITLETMEFPDPVISQAVEPKTKVDQEKMGVALSRLAQEDPSFRVRTDDESGQTIISGMGELHLEIIVDRMQREFGVKARVGNPQVAYRETVDPARRGREQVRPPASSGGRAASTATSGWSSSRPSAAAATSTRIARRPADIPQEHAPRSRPASPRRVRARRPRRPPDDRPPGPGRRRQLSPVDSNDYAFKVARRQGVRRGRAQGGPDAARAGHGARGRQLPTNTSGDVLGDLHARRGKVAGITARPGVQTVACFVPMASMFGYATDLRSRTRGRATYAMELDHYAEVPQQLRDDHRCSQPASSLNRPGERSVSKRNSSATSPTSTSERSVTSTTARPR